MSVKRIIQFAVICDTCKREFTTDEQVGMGARIRAAVDGWKYAEGRLPGPGKTGQRQFDYCPKCWPTSPHANGARP